MNKKFITTTLPYVNSTPHIGHALEFIQADCIARHYRQNDFDVRFNVGVDEHGLKVYLKASELGQEPKEYVDGLAILWQEFCKQFQISYTSFYRTSSQDHKIAVSGLWGYFKGNNDLYTGIYQGLYCVGCESLKTPKELVDGVCPDHSNTCPQPVEESNYFFKYSKYKEQLLDWLAGAENFIYPKVRKQELLNLIADSPDISVSRKKDAVQWGIPVPYENEQLIYVWFEALLNYILAAGYEERALFKEYWSNSVQLCGRDNLRFQGSFLQAILLALNVNHTSQLVVHGTVLDEQGRKISKTLDNVIDPIIQLEKYGLDAVRYYIIAGLSTFEDSKYSEKELVEVYNTHLANGVGNLFARTIQLILNFDIEITNIDEVFGEKINEVREKLSLNWQSFRLKEVCETLQNFSGYCNKYLTESEVWKQDNNRQQVLTNLYHSLEFLATELEFVIPESALQIKRGLTNRKKEIIFPKK